MNKLKYILIIPIIFGFATCSDYVTDVDPFIDRVTDVGLNGESYVDGLIIGLENQANWAIDDALVNADGLSDALIFDRRNANATFSGLENADQGLQQDTDSEFSGPFTQLHELRVQADTLVYRIENKITFSNVATKNKGLYSAYLWSGIANFYLGSYYGKSQTVGGSPINLRRFYTTAELYNIAIVKLKTAITYTTDPTQIKVANSFMAKIYLCMKDYANAATHANLGLKKGDAALTLKYNTTNNNAYRLTAGDTRTQFSLDPRFKAYTVADATEKNRIKFTSFTGTGGFVYDSQRKYVLTGSDVTPIEVVDWLEINLIRAELILRGNATGDALALVNEVRTQGGAAVKTAGTVLSILPEAGKYSIYEERDKALWLRGLRILDQIRLDKWHLPGGTWKWYQIPYNEKQKNKNWDK
ncbi:MAG: hypothetical protein CVV24_01730 [Ignavibacteriae bacterium HGW-Ignavibacteriae-3]|nr:MAG: hypothetical protein CVV24_01730 [Ignavibacteriae bacterium HGW-Ignavibacteriae-3]